MTHQFWTRHIGRWGLYLHRYQPSYHNRLTVVRHRDAENIMPYGPVLVVHIFWRRWQLSIDRKRRPRR